MSRPVLMDFYADWCGPCKRQGPILQELQKKLGDRIEIQKIDVDQHMDKANQYGIRVVPTLIIEKDGTVIRTLEGVTGTEALEALLQPLVD
jgi:thioredoxin 1